MVSQLQKTGTLTMRKRKVDIGEGLIPGSESTTDICQPGKTFSAGQKQLSNLFPQMLNQISIIMALQNIRNLRYLMNHRN